MDSLMGEVDMVEVVVVVMCGYSIGGGGVREKGGKRERR